MMLINTKSPARPTLDNLQRFMTDPIDDPCDRVLVAGGGTFACVNLDGKLHTMPISNPSQR